MTDRKKKKRALEKAGIVHAAGWLNEVDLPKFERMVKSAADKVKEVTKSADKF